MDKRPPYPVLCLIVGGALSVLVLYFLSTVGNHHRPLPIAGAAFVLLVAAMMKGDPWQKMVAGALLFVPSFGLLMSVMD